MGRPAAARQAVFHVLVSTDESETDVILACLECLSSLADGLLHRCEVLSAPDTRQPPSLVRPWLSVRRRGLSAAECAALGSLRG